MGDIRPRPPDDGWDDPGGLIDSWLWAWEHPSHGPEAMIVAWLSTLHPAVPPPLAARSLLGRLTPAYESPLPTRHRRLLDLLGYVAGFQPAPGRTAVTPDNDTDPLENDPS